MPEGVNSMYYQQGPYGPPPQPTMMITSKSPATAVMLELLPGMFFQTFGIGHMYAGNVGAGLAFMFGYWFVTAINAALCLVLVGFITWPLCWLAAMIISSILASNAAKTANERALRGIVT